MNILDIAIAKKLAGGGGGSGTDNYNDLSNLPKINDTTLSGNKSSSALGLQSEINSDSKLASDLVDDTNQDNKFVTSTEKNTWNAKQNAIDSDHKLSSDLVDDANKTNKFVTSTEKNTWNAKQNAIDSEHKLSSSLVSFTDAEAAALASGIDSSKVGQISTNQTNILYAVNKVGKNLFNPDSLSNLYNMAVGVNAYTYQSTDTDTNTSFRFRLQVFDESTAGAIIYSKDNVTTGILAVPFTKTASFNIIRFGNSGASKDAKISINVSNLENDKDYILAFNVTAANPSVSIAWTDTMICDKSIYDQDSTFQPYGAPNYDLTRLQSEDRAALAEQVDKGAKNRFDEWNEIYKINKQYATSDNTISMNDVTFTYADGSITVSGTASSDVYFFVLTDSMQLSNENLVVAWRSKTVNTMSLYVKYLGIDPIETTNSVLELPYRTDSASMAIHIPSGTQVSGTIDLMICTEEEFKISPTYQPYALPNSDLTYLEAEDRAALAEVVDSGAKNLATLATISMSASGSSAENIAITLKAGSYAVSYDYTVTSRNVQLYFTGGGYTHECTSKSGSGHYEEIITVPSDVTTYYRVYSSGSAATVSNIMVCTKAAFGVSKAFVPYRLPLSDNTWVKSSDLFPSHRTEFDVSNSHVYTYTNKFLNKVVVSIELKAATAISSTTGVLAIASNIVNIPPKTVYYAVPELTNDFECCILKNNANGSLAFKVTTGTISSGTTFNVQFEYTYGLN
jgi:hypothetical protein